MRYVCINKEHDPKHRVFQGFAAAWWHRFAYDRFDDEAPWGPKPRPYDHIEGTRPSVIDGKTKIWPSGQELQFINFEKIPTSRWNTFAEYVFYDKYSSGYLRTLRKKFPGVRIGAYFPYFDYDLAVQRSQGTIDPKVDKRERHWWDTIVQSGEDSPLAFFDLLDVLMIPVGGYADLDVRQWLPELLDRCELIQKDIIFTVDSKHKDRDAPGRPSVYVDLEDIEYICSNVAARGYKDVLHWVREDDFDGQIPCAEVIDQYFGGDA